MGISEQTFYRWKKLYGDLGTGELAKPEATRGRKPQAQAAGRQSQSRHAHFAGCAVKKSSDVWSAARTRAASSSGPRSERMARLRRVRRRSVDDPLSFDQA